MPNLRVFGKTNKKTRQRANYAVGFYLQRKSLTKQNHPQRNNSICQAHSFSRSFQLSSTKEIFSCCAFLKFIKLCTSYIFEFFYYSLAKYDIKKTATFRHGPLCIRLLRLSFISFLVDNFYLLFVDNDDNLMIAFRAEDFHVRPVVTLQ